MVAKPQIESTPFSISPNPNSLYITPSLKGVLAKARFTINKRQGLTCAALGDVGMGKSTVLRYLYGEYAAKEDVVATLIPTPKFPTLFGMLKYICSDFEIEPRRSFIAQQDALQEFLLAQYQDEKNVVLFIDEAQLLDNQQLELIRGFLNFETNEHKLIQIALAGQLELKDKLNTEKNKALYSRISTYSMLDPLTPEETKAMIEHRCIYAGIQSPFTDEAVETVFIKSKGIPRNILKLCALAYEMMDMAGEKEIDASYIVDATPEVAVE
jgi:type II secretory pathway predicted ATPase ExeA